MVATTTRTWAPVWGAAMLGLGLACGGYSSGAMPLPEHRGELVPDLVPGAHWERLADPVAVGWNPAGIAAAREIWEANSGTSAVVIVWKGVVVEHWGETDAKWTGRSIRKSLLSSLWAEPVASGKMRMDATLADLGIDDRTPLSSAEKQATFADLLASRSGVYIPAARENSGHRKRRPVRGSHPPGTFYYYNNWDFNVLGVLYRDRIATDVGGAFARQIAQPIGMEDYVASDFEWRPERISPHPAYDFEMSTRDLARYGLLWLRGGRWGERQLIDADWIRKSTTAITEETFAGAGYGMLWWAQPAGKSKLVPEGYFYAEGGSYLWVVPSRDLVVVHHRKSNQVLLRSKLGLLPDEEKVWEIFAKIVEAAPRGTPPAAS
jgi:CubicO group peptidase (beta-lactamase class C family)